MLPTHQGFLPLSLPATRQVPCKGSRGGAYIPRSACSWQWVSQALSHGVTKFTLPTSTLPGLAFIISVTISTQVGRKEAGTVPGTHPRTAWEEGRQRSLTHKTPHWPGCSAEALTTEEFLKTEYYRSVHPSVCLSVFLSRVKTCATTSYLQGFLYAWQTFYPMGY